MALKPDEVERLNNRTQEVGGKIGWELEVHVAPNPEFVALQAGPDGNFIDGPMDAGTAAQRITQLLDDLDTGKRQIQRDDQDVVHVLDAS